MSNEPTVLIESLINYAAERIAFSVRKYVLKKEVSIILYGEKQEEVTDPLTQKKVMRDTGLPVKLIGIKTFEVLRKKAREVLQLRAAANTVQARQESIGFYENLLSDPTTNGNVRIKARQNLDKILGVADHTPGAFIPPLAGNVKSMSVSIEGLNLTLEQKKKLLENNRADSNDTGTTK